MTRVRACLLMLLALLAGCGGEVTLDFAGFSDAELVDMSVSWTAAVVTANGRTLSRKTARVSGG